MRATKGQDTLMDMCKYFPLVVALGVFAGCGSDPAGPVEGPMEGAVVDRPDQGSTYDGSMAGDFQFSVSTDGQTWVDVGSPNGITMALRSNTETSLHGSQEAPTGSFTRVRMLVRAAEVTVSAGSEIDGTTFPSEMKVDVARSEDLFVVRQIPSPTVEADEALVVTFDLNSESWLTADAVNAGTVSNAALESAVTVAT